MTLATVWAAIQISIGFTAWPNGGKALGLSNGWMLFIMMVVTITVSTVMTRHEFGPMPAAWKIGAMAVISIVNGYALILYGRYASDPAIPTPDFVALVSMIQVGMSPLYKFILSGQFPSLRCCAGYGAGMVAIYLLTR